MGQINVIGNNTLVRVKEPGRYIVETSFGEQYSINIDSSLLANNAKNLKLFPLKHQHIPLNINKQTINLLFIATGPLYESFLLIQIYELLAHTHSHYHIYILDSGILSPSFNFKIEKIINNHKEITQINPKYTLEHKITYL